MPVTKNIAKYVSDIGINLSELARKTNLSYANIYASLGRADSDRDLKAEELIRICVLLHINPLDFKDTDTDTDPDEEQEVVV